MSNSAKPPKMGAISKAFAGMEVIDGIKKTRDEFKNTDNVHDVKLGVSMKGHKTPKLASEELGDLIKMAGIGGWSGKAVKEAVKRGVREFDADTAKNVAGAINATKNKQFGSAIKSGAKAFPGVALNAGLAVGGGIGVTKGLDALDKKNTDENKMSHKIVGATVGAGLAATALTGGGLSQGAKIIKDNVKKSVIKHPLNQYANNNNTFKNVKETASKVSGSVGKATAKENKLNENAKNMVKSYRKATENKNPVYNQGMGAGLSSLKSDARTSFKDGFLVDNPNATPEQISKAWLKSDQRKQFKETLNRAKTSIRSADKEISANKNTAVANKAREDAKWQNKKTQQKASDRNANQNRNVESAASNIVGTLRRDLTNPKEQYRKDLTTALRDLSAKEQDKFVDKFMLKNKGATMEDAKKAWKSSSEKSTFDKASRMAVPTVKRMTKNAGTELDEILKLAGFRESAKPIINGVGRAGVYIGDKIITPALTAMSTTAAPVIATTLLSQRMLNQAKEEKEESQQVQQAQSAPQPQTLVIKLDTGATPQSEEKIAADDQSHDIGNVLTETIKGLNEIKGTEKLRTERIHVGNGRKKLFRMQEHHGMDGMQP